MEDRIYDYWAATLQDGYIGQLIDIVQAAGGAREFYRMSPEKMTAYLGISGRLAKYIDEHKADVGAIEDSYRAMEEKGISYVNHTDMLYPPKLGTIASRPYGLFVKGSLPDPGIPSVAIIGARDCTEYGRTMAEYFGSRLAAENVQIISGMAWGIDGISQEAALSAGGKSFAVLGCGSDVIYPARNRILYGRLSSGGNGIISEYAPGTAAEARRFPPRNRIISALSDVVIVVEAKERSGTLITVDMAIDQGRTVMVVPGRLTDPLSAGCLNLMYLGALPATGIESVMDLLGRGTCGADEKGADGKSTDNAGTVIKKMRPKKPKSSVTVKKRELPDDMARIYDVLTSEPQSAEKIALAAGMPLSAVLVILTKLELEGAAKEVWPGCFVSRIELA